MARWNAKKLIKSRIEYHWASEVRANGMRHPEELEREGWKRVVAHSNYPKSWLMRREKQETSYTEFLHGKRRRWDGHGLHIPESELPPLLYPFQKALTRWALRKGKAALWADTGLGKTLMQITWAAQIPGRVLILAPLCVSLQTIQEAKKLGIDVIPQGGGGQIEIINYERLHQVNPSDYTGVVLDESSILKSFDGKTRTKLIRLFAETPYRLCCTATPAPNDIAELANHCEFLGIMTRAEMLATFFVHDETEWRLKGHATEAFYLWLASWGLFLRKPSDLGFSDDGFDLPMLRIHDLIVGPTLTGEYLFPGMGLGGIRGRLSARRGSLNDRVDAAAQLALTTPGQWLIWCGLNDEQHALARLLGSEAMSIQGADSIEHKEAGLRSFLTGESRILLTKPKIAGFGLNLQHCYQMIFLGLGDSYETYYQAIRRCWRFGQTRPVSVYVIVSPSETEIVANVRRKETEATEIAAGLIVSMRETEKEEIGMTIREQAQYREDRAEGQDWTLYLGDAVEVLQRLPEASIDLSVYSPPFQSLFTYTASDRDLGNSSSQEEFLTHFGYVSQELLRVTKPGRLTCCHIAQVASTKVTHGVIGLIDLRGAVIRCFVQAGWVYHGDICIDKNPQAQAIRTHSKALLFAQLKKDASWLRPGLADYILIFRHPGENIVPIHPDISNEDWIQWARPIWYDIRENDTLQATEAREEKDDRHICPLQLPVIERCIRLWSNLGETVLSPFVGIGSEGYEAMRLGRKFIGVELKEAYWRVAVKNLQMMETQIRTQLSMFDRSTS